MIRSKFKKYDETKNFLVKKKQKPLGRFCLQYKPYYYDKYGDKYKHTPFAFSINVSIVFNFHIGKKSYLIDEIPFYIFENCYLSHVDI